MYLKRLELQGFKSFADKTVVDFEKGITGIVGPNGSGKSNISDSIRWVLGEQSAKTLRGSKMEDIIFAGTTRRRPLGFGEITLVLDNKEGKMPIDYSEVSVTRRVFRSGESEYYLNKTSCRLKDIKEVFMDTGIGIDGYSIIGQGRIDAILSSKSEDRRLLFEEAAGIVKYKTRKQEAEKKLEKTRDNLIRINDIIRELNNQIEPLKKQSEKAKQYITIKEELQKLEVNLFIREISRLNEQISILDSQRQLVEKQIKFNNEKKISIEKNFRLIKTEIDNINNNIESIQELRYKTQNNIEKIDGEINLNNEKLSFYNKEIIRLEDEIQSINNNTQRIDSEKVVLENKKNELLESLSKLNNQLNNKIELLDNVSVSIDTIYNGIEESKSKVIETLNSITEKKSRISTIKSFGINIKKRIEQLLEDIVLLKEDENKNQMALTNTEREIISIENEIASLNKKRKENENEKNSLSNKVFKLSNELNDIKGGIQGKVSKLNLLVDMKNEYEGYYKSVKHAIGFSKSNNDLGKSVKGVVGELITVDKNYEVAIEVALGSSLQNIVTETEYDAKKIISYLKNNNLGRVTFLPKSSIKGRYLNDKEVKALKTEGVIDVASNLIKYDNEFKEIFNYLLGRVVVTTNMDTGIKVSKLVNHSLKIVTLDGDILNPGGSITGGSYNSKTTNLLGRERNINEIEEDIENNKVKYKKLNKELELYNASLTELENEIKKIENQINDLNVIKAKKDNTVINLMDKSYKVKSEIDKISNEKDHLINENKGSDDDIIKFEEEILELEEKHKSLEVLINEKNKEYDREKLVKDNLEKEITEIRIKIASYNQEIKSIIDNIQKFDNDSTNRVTAIINKEKEFNDNKKKIELINSSTVELSLNKESLSNKLIEYENSIESVKIKKDDLVKIYNSEQENISTLGVKIIDLEKSLTTLDVKQAKYNMQLDNYNGKLWEEYELTYQMALKYQTEIDNMSKVQNEVRVLKSKIKSLGSVNIDSIDEYEKVLERYNFMSEQNDDLLAAKDSLIKVIKDMEIKMKDQFLINFKIIKENFIEVFTKLFGGGKADIFLEDEENLLTSGIEIIAQPPGKKLQNISLLSGGEKALTAIALLFAILKLKPTPFCILDEIEAALDDANVYRFADYLKEFSDRTQFIVITHRKGTMESVDSLYGVTMEEEGVSKLVSVKLSEKLTEKVS